MILTFIFILSTLILPYITGWILVGFSFFSKRDSFILLFVASILMNLIFLDISTGQGLDIDRYISNTQLLTSIHGIINKISFVFNSGYFDYEKPSYLFFLLQIVVSKTHYLTLLPFLSCVLVTFLLFYPFLDIANRFEKYKIIAFILGVLSFLLFAYGYWMASSLRWSLAVSSEIFIDYLYFTKINKKRYLILLFIPILFHIGIGIAVIISVYFALIRRTNLLTFILASIFLLGFAIFLTSSNHFSLINPFINKMIYNYTANNEFINQQSSTLKAVLPSDISLFSIILLWFLNPGLFKLIFKDKFTTMTLFFIIFILLLIKESMIFERYLGLIFIFVTINLLYNFNYSINIINIRTLLFYLIMILLIISVFIRSYLKFKAYQFSIGNVEKIIFANIFTIMKGIPYYSGGF